MARSTIGGYWRQRGGRGTPAPVPAVLAFSVPAESVAGTLTGKVLPKGARLLEVMYNGAGTGGTSPIFNLGWVGALDALVAAGAADGGPARALLVEGALSEDREVTYGAGTAPAAATGGMVHVAIAYVMTDDGSLNN